MSGVLRHSAAMDVSQILLHASAVMALLMIGCQCITCACRRRRAALVHEIDRLQKCESMANAARDLVAAARKMSINR